MTRKTAAALVVLSVLLGGLVGFVLQRVDDQPAAAAQDDRRSTPTAAPTADPTRPVVAPGRIGDARVGMTRRQLEGTGLFERDTESCVGPLPFYRWRGALGDRADVVVDRQGRIVSLGVTGAGPRTAQGIGTGSTYDELRKAYPGLTGPARTVYGQAGAFVRDGDRWIGFLLDTAPTLVREETPVSFIEVTTGHRPTLVRDGC